MTATSGSLAQLLRGVEFSQAVTIQLSGDCRPALNHAAYECARTINPGFLWLEVRIPGEPTDSREPSAQGLIPEGQLLTTNRPQDVAPENAVANMALSTVVLAGDGPSEVGHFVDFLRTPNLVQELFPAIERSVSDRPGVFALMNGDRLAGFYPGDVKSTQAFIEVYKRERITLVAASRHMHRPDRIAFDYVFTIETDSEESWASSRALCEQAPVGSCLQAGLRYEVFVH